MVQQAHSRLNFILHSIVMGVSYGFFSVCRSWRSVAESARSDFISSQSPLLHHHLKVRSTIRLYSLTGNRFYSSKHLLLHAVLRKQLYPGYSQGFLMWAWFPLADFLLPSSTCILMVNLPSIQGNRHAYVVSAGLLTSGCRAIAITHCFKKPLCQRAWQEGGMQPLHPVDMVAIAALGCGALFVTPSWHNDVLLYRILVYSSSSFQSSGGDQLNVFV